VQLDRGPGQREERYGHLLCGPAGNQAGDAVRAQRAAPPSAATPAPGEALARLEERVAALEREVAALKAEPRTPAG
jgi:uncharacterized protein